MSTHIIYHQVKPGIDCPDGIMSAAIVYGYHRGMGEAVTVAGASYRKEYPSTPDIEIPIGTRKLVIVDFSYPSEWLLYWELQQKLIVTVFEHHADKFGWLQDFSGAVLDSKECGASLVWKFYYGKDNHAIPAILEHVRRRDIGLDGYYEGLTPESEAINLGLGMYRKNIKGLGSIEQLSLLNAIVVDAQQSEIPFFLSSGLLQIEERDRLIAERLPLGKPESIDGNTCVFFDFTDDPAIAPHYSVFGHQLAKHHGVNLAWMIDGKLNHLRSLTPSVDCSAIAARRGGGGHPCAAGWQA